MDNDDKYIHDMDWVEEPGLFSDSSNYRNYQYNLIKKYIGKEILEVGSGNRSFTNIIYKNNKDIERLLSIEPYPTFYNNYSSNYKFSEFVEFKCIDLFDLDIQSAGRFDTVIFVHVLEHIEKDRVALDIACDLTKTGGYILIEVPAFQFLYSIHDEMLGHHRRYNKRSLKAIVDFDKLEIIKLWYQDPIGVFGSWLYFKKLHVKLKSNKGAKLVATQGNIYDKYVIPIEIRIEQYITFPFGLSLTAVLRKK